MIVNDMSREQHFDVLIVGAGMVGCTMACLLVDDPLTQNFRIGLIEADNTEPGVAPAFFDARVVALSNNSKNILNSVGAWQALNAQRMCAYEEMRVWDGDGTADIHFSCHDIRQPQLGYIAENNLLLSALREQVKSRQQITLLCPAMVKKIDLAASDTDKVQHIEIEYENETRQLTCSLVIAADGARSSIRNLLNIPTREWDYGHAAIVTTIETEKEHNNTAWQRFTTNGPIAFLPLGEINDPGDSNVRTSGKQKYSSLVWSAESALASKLMAMNDSEFCDALASAFEYKLGKIIHVDKRYSLPLRQRHAQSYVRPGLALVGDAAHTIHPLAGQGVNLGLYDVKALAKEIVRSRQRDFELNDFSILQRYERSRQSHNLLAMATMEGFKRLFAAEQPAVRWLRNAGMRFFNQQDWLKKKLMLLASG